MSSTQNLPQPLAERSCNTSPKKQPSQPDAKSQDQPDMREKSTITGLQQAEHKHAFISPSDTIMSPTTKKLEAIRGKRFASGKPQSLFAKTVSKQGLVRSQSGDSLEGGK